MLAQLPLQSNSILMRKHINRDKNYGLDVTTQAAKIIELNS
jgi:hypothetical protein